MTQRRASTRFDLPQPFGPTIPGQARIDEHLGLIDKGFKTMELKSREMHESI